MIDCHKIGLGHVIISLWGYDDSLVTCLL